MVEVLKVPEVMRCVLLRVLEVVEGVLCLLEVPEVMRCVLLRVLKVVEGMLCLLELPEVMRCVLLCILELWRVGSVCWRYWDGLDMLEVTRRFVV